MKTHDFIREIFPTTTARIEAAISAGAITTPVWHEHLKHVSDEAALLAPVLGCVWLSLQIGAWLWKREWRAKAQNG